MRRGGGGGCVCTDLQWTTIGHDFPRNDLLTFLCVDVDIDREKEGKERKKMVSEGIMISN